MLHSAIAARKINPSSKKQNLFDLAFHMSWLLKPTWLKVRVRPMQFMNKPFSGWAEHTWNISSQTKPYSFRLSKQSVSEPILIKAVKVCCLGYQVIGWGYIFSQDIVLTLFREWNGAGGSLWCWYSTKGDEPRRFQHEQTALGVCTAHHKEI